ncbi:adenosine 5'-monophosphoramidase HINT2-like isoform X2 [Galleria mellonella]|uniref:Adenosine 5'-monophosphoramidase HINT2-like isoform X2 n=1 Tax=Galleria mellonella TaxID=7137 RepID=A0A6J1WMG9_GALME|nr:adenosine 5'-monophosphoramidase HINT2-like isoform X2 [Galleria mellonella]
MAAIDIEQTKNPYFGGKSPPQYIFEDEQCIVFEADEDRQAPVHFIVVPKKVLPRLSVATEEDERLLGHLLIVSRHVAKLKGISDSGFRVVMNEGKHGGQTVNQFHIQVFGGRQMYWPFG